LPERVYTHFRGTIFGRSCGVTQIALIFRWPYRVPVVWLADPSPASWLTELEIPTNGVQKRTVF
jgi:hypothetical protein